MKTILKFVAEGPREVSARTYRFVASTSERDRDGDVLSVTGWELDAYKKNPVVLASHNAKALPVAKARVWIEGGRLMADITFPPPGTSKASDEAHALVAGGFLRAVSVGFMPKERQPLPDGKGWLFTRQELTEISLVSVPALPSAVLAASLGGKTPTVQQWGPQRKFILDPDSVAALTSRLVAEEVRRQVRRLRGRLD